MPQIAPAIDFSLISRDRTNAQSPRDKRSHILSWLIFTAHLGGTLITQHNTHLALLEP